MEVEECVDSYCLLFEMELLWMGFFEFLYGLDYWFEGLCDMGSFMVFYGFEFIWMSGFMILVIVGCDSVLVVLGYFYFNYGIMFEIEISMYYWSFLMCNFCFDDEVFDQMFIVMDCEVWMQDVVVIEVVEVRVEEGVV